jgi:hypothetical protein
VIEIFRKMVPLTGFEPVTPSLRMELRKPIKPIYYKGLSIILVLPGSRFQAPPKLG